MDIFSRSRSLSFISIFSSVSSSSFDSEEGIWKQKNKARWSSIQDHSLKTNSFSENILSDDDEI